MNRSPEGWSRGTGDLGSAAAASYVALCHGLWQHRQHVCSGIGASKTQSGVRVVTAERAGEVILGERKARGEGMRSNVSRHLQRLQPPDLSSPAGTRVGIIISAARAEKLSGKGHVRVMQYSVMEHGLTRLVRGWEAITAMLPRFFAWSTWCCCCWGERTC